MLPRNLDTYSRDFDSKEGAFIKYKGRGYTWVKINNEGKISLSDDTMQYLKLKKNMKLLSIRSSDIAFTMGAYGPLLEESFKHDNEIKVY